MTKSSTIRSSSSTSFMLSITGVSVICAHVKLEDIVGVLHSCEILDFRETCRLPDGLDTDWPNRVWANWAFGKNSS